MRYGGRNHKVALLASWHFKLRTVMDRVKWFYIIVLSAVLIFS
jgi:hypothetical protein